MKIASSYRKFFQAENSNARVISRFKRPERYSRVLTESAQKSRHRLIPTGEKRLVESMDLICLIAFYLGYWLGIQSAYNSSSTRSDSAALILSVDEKNMLNEHLSDASYSKVDDISLNLRTATRWHPNSFILAIWPERSSTTRSHQSPRQVRFCLSA